MFFNGFCLLYVKIWNLLISQPVSFSGRPLSPKHISQTQCLLKLMLMLLQIVFLCCHVYCEGKAFTVLKKYLEAYNLLPCLDISMFLCVFWGPSSHCPDSYQISGHFPSFFSRECCLFLAMVLRWSISVHCKGSLHPDGKRCLVCGGIFSALSVKDMPLLVFCQLYGTIKAEYENVLVLLKCLHIWWSVISGTRSSLKAWDWYWKTCLVSVHSFLHTTQDTNMQDG